jgi:hypothetical protein
LSARDPNVEGTIEGASEFERPPVGAMVGDSVVLSQKKRHADTPVVLSGIEN